MKKGLLIGLGVVGVAAVLLIIVIAWFISANNRFVALQENVHSAWGQVETVLQRRYDLIPNLVNTVKGYAKHEKGVLEEVTRLRSQWGSARTVDEKVKAAGRVGRDPLPLAPGCRAIPRPEGQCKLPRPPI